jgi:pantothenate synthetase
MQETLRKEPLIAEIQYAGAYDTETLDEVAAIKGEALLAVAVKIGHARLIDNMLAKGK